MCPVTHKLDMQLFIPDHSTFKPPPPPSNPSITNFNTPFRCVQYSAWLVQRGLGRFLCAPKVRRSKYILNISGISSLCTLYVRVCTLHSWHTMCASKRDRLLYVTLYKLSSIYPSLCTQKLVRTFFEAHSVSSLNRPAWLNKYNCVRTQPYKNQSYLLNLLYLKFQ